MVFWHGNPVGKILAAFPFPNVLGYQNAPLVILRPSLVIEVVQKAVSTTEGERTLTQEALDL